MQLPRGAAALLPGVWACAAGGLLRLRWAGVTWGRAEPRGPHFRGPAGMPPAPAPCQVGGGEGPRLPGPGSVRDSWGPCMEMWAGQGGLQG